MPLSQGRRQLGAQGTQSSLRAHRGWQGALSTHVGASFGLCGILTQHPRAQGPAHQQWDPRKCHLPESLFSTQSPPNTLQEKKKKTRKRSTGFCPPRRPLNDPHVSTWLSSLCFREKIQGRLEGSAPFEGQEGGKPQAPARQSDREWQVGHS